MSFSKVEKKKTINQQICVRKCSIFVERGWLIIVIFVISLNITDQYAIIQKKRNNNENI